MKQLKYKYRDTGCKKFIPPIEYSVEALQILKNKGYTIVLLSARPYKEHPRIFSDTLFWLKDNNFCYDAIIWDEKKEERIMSEFPKMQYMIEDCLENANKVAEQGYTVFLINKPYNQGKTSSGVVRIDNWKKILEEIK